MAYPPTTTYRATSLSEAQYNADIVGLAAAMTPANINDYSDTVVEMQTVVNPGGVGTESQATDLAGEIARLRYMIKLITGAAQWYVDPGVTISAAQFAAGTRVVFNQSSAPVGWTKETDADYDNAALRCTSTSSLLDPNVYNPGRTGMGTVMSTAVVGSTTLSTAQMPAHTHTVTYYESNTTTGFVRFASGGFTGTVNTGSTGSSSSHNHSINLLMKFVDIIVAEKN